MLSIITCPWHEYEVLQSACLSVCPLTYLKNNMSKHTKFPIRVTVAVARSSSDDNAISCVLPVLWMTS